MGNLALLESLDSCAPTRNRLRSLAAKVGEWAGIPLPLDGEELKIAPGYPFAECMTIKPDNEDAGLKLRNSFYSSRRRCDIYVIEENGKIDFGVAPAVHHFDQDIRTLGCSAAWGLEQEQTALKLLGTLVRHSTFKQYLLTGMFLETSKRSGLTYMFRKLKPTVAITQHKGHLRILCALCMHPIAYYAGSWAGAMCPTDDVVAHLMLMRADEPMYWRRCNQHAAHRPEAGL